MITLVGIGFICHAGEFKDQPIRDSREKALLEAYWNCPYKKCDSALMAYLSYAETADVKYGKPKIPKMERRRMDTTAVLTIQKEEK